MDIEDTVVQHIDNYETRKKKILKKIDEKKLIEFMTILACQTYESREQYNKEYNKLRRQFKLCPSKVQLLFIYNDLVKNNTLLSNSTFEFYGTRKIGKSHSGITNITVLTSPFPEYTKNGERVKQSFSCGKNCAYCPNEPAHEGNNMQAQPRSYIYTEPAVLRANGCGFDAVIQFKSRATTLNMCGHIVDKVELFILGGTWSHYPKEYREEFIRDLFYAANTLLDKENRERLSLEEEHKINESSLCRIIGLTIETRPDCINKREILHMRKLGVTRIQLGIQHLDNNILEYINRDCTTEDTMYALKLWKKNGGKVDIHIMPDLPGSSLEQDKEMFNEFLDNSSEYKIKPGFKYKLLEYLYLEVGIVFLLTLILTMYSNILQILLYVVFILLYLNHAINQKDYIYNMPHFHRIYYLRNEDIQADQWKIYPTMTTRWTDIKDWYDDGTYKPYAEENNGEHLTNLLIEVKQKVFPWIRLNRIIRDIPQMEIYGGHKKGNLRQDIHDIFIAKGYKCKCIRCREVKCIKSDLSKAILCIREYDSNDGTEYFISYESRDGNLLYGFIRLRINNNNNDVFFNVLKDCGLVRELHVYGQLVEHNDKNSNIQHYGFGKKLLIIAEQLTKKNGKKKIAIISGIGVKEYYRKRGYISSNTYMVKHFY